jgi:hypothetical protein
MSGSRVLCRYVSDNGTTYQMTLDATNAAAVGAANADGTEPFYPPRWRPRYVLAQHPDTGQQKRIIVPAVGHATWPVNGGTLTLVDTSVHPSEDVAYKLRGRVGEKRYAGKTPAGA